jgi:hypothetical protein
VTGADVGKARLEIGRKRRTTFAHHLLCVTRSVPQIRWNFIVRRHVGKHPAVDFGSGADIAAALDQHALGQKSREIIRIDYKGARDRRHFVLAVPQFAKRVGQVDGDACRVGIGIGRLPQQ